MNRREFCTNFCLVSLRKPKLPVSHLTEHYLADGICKFLCNFGIYHNRLCQAPEQRNQNFPKISHSLFISDLLRRMQYLHT